MTLPQLVAPGRAILQHPPASSVPTRVVGEAGTSTRTLTARIEERLVIPTCASRWAFAPIFAHRTMSLPLQLAGQGQRRTVFSGDSRLEVLGIGRDKLIRSLCSRLFGYLPTARKGWRRPTWSPESLTHLEADLVVAEVHRWMAPRFRRAGWLIVPRSVRWHGDLANIPPVVPSRSLRINLEKIRKHNFGLIQANTPADWAEFFDTMVEPQARVRHGGTAWLPSQAFRQKIAQSGIVHFVVKDGVRVAGACCVPNGDLLWFPLLGVKKGDAQLLKRGAGVAALALPLEWARQQNYRRIDLGRTGPFVHDGLQQYKRNWGFVPVPDPLSLITAVWVGSEAARQAFAREPVLVEDGSGLRTYAGEPL